MALLTYAALGGHAYLERRLYLPAALTDDRARCREAGKDGRSRPTMSALPSACPKLCLVQGGTQGRETERGKNGVWRIDGGPQAPA
jgi:hypothetical protein